MLLAAALLAGSAGIAKAQSLESIQAQADEDLAKSLQLSLEQARAKGVEIQGIQDWWRQHTQGAPYTGRHRILFFPAKQANALGKMIYDNMIKTYKDKGLIDNDPEAVAQIKRVCDKLIASANQPDLAWEYHYIDTGTVNAFAVAGGKIGVLKGILKYTQDDLGLAVVLAHEVAHVHNRHLDERLSQIIVIQALSMAGSIALPHVIPVLLPAWIAHMANALATVNQIYQLIAYEGQRLGMAGFSRVAEYEADHVGLIFMAKAGYDPMLAVDFWKRMLSAYPDPKHPELVKWWRSHPLTSERIAAITKWAPEVRDQYYHPNDPGMAVAAAGQDSRSWSIAGFDLDGGEL